MEDGTNRQLIAKLRERVHELEALQTGREAIETELSGARQRYQLSFAKAVRASSDRQV